MGVAIREGAQLGPGPHGANLELAPLATNNHVSCTTGNIGIARPYFVSFLTI